MVDPVGIKAASVSDRRAAPVAAAEPAARIRSVSGDPAPQEAAGAAARSLASSAPVDGERVARIRKAVQDGRFPIYPTTIADRLLALKFEWNPHE